MIAAPFSQASAMGDEEELQEDVVMLGIELSDSRNSEGNWDDMEVDDELAEKRYDVFPALRVTSCTNHLLIAGFFSTWVQQALLFKGCLTMQI